MNNSNGLRLIEKHWKLFAFVISVVIAWTTLKIAVGQNTIEIMDIKDENKGFNATLQEVKLDITSIKTSVEYIEENFKNEN